MQFSSRSVHYHLTRFLIQIFIIFVLFSTSFLVSPAVSAELTEELAGQIKTAVDLLSSPNPGAQGEFLMKNWDLVIKMTKYPDKFPSKMFSKGQVKLLDTLKRTKFLNLRKKFVEGMAAKNPALVGKIRGFMKTGSWAKSFNPSYVEVVSDFDMTVVGDSLEAEKQFSEEFYNFLKKEGFDVDKMDVTVFPVPASMKSKAGEVFEGGGMKFVDVYNETDGKFDSLSFDKDGKYKGIIKNQSPEASFGVVYDDAGRPVGLRKEFAKFTAADAPDLINIQRKKFLEEFADKVKSGKPITKADVKKVSKFLSRSAYGKKIMKGAKEYSDIEKISFKIKWSNADPDELLKDRIQGHLKKMGSTADDAAALTKAKNLAYKDYFNQASYNIRQNADEASDMKVFKSKFISKMKNQRPLFGRILANLDKIQYVTAIYNIYKAYSSAPDDKKVNHAVFTTAKELLEIKIPGMTWTNLSATIVYASLAGTAKAFYGMVNEKAGLRMMETIFQDRNIMKMSPAEIESHISKLVDDPHFNTEGVYAGFGNMYTKWDKKQGKPKELIYWAAINYKREMAFQMWKNKKGKYEKQKANYNKIIAHLKALQTVEAEDRAEEELLDNKMTFQQEGSESEMERLQRENADKIKKDIEDARARAKALLEKKKQEEEKDFGKGDDDQENQKPDITLLRMMKV